MPVYGGWFEVTKEPDSAPWVPEKNRVFFAPKGGGAGYGLPVSIVATKSSVL